MLAERLRNWFGEAPENSIFGMKYSEEDHFCLNSHIGLQRADNQDRTAALFVNSGGASQNSFYCFVLCDGMGGMKDGSIAASLSISSFLESLILLRNEPPEKRLLHSAVFANSTVNKSVGGGSTLSAVLFAGGAVFSLNAGDSRIYTKSKDREIKRHTTDDNLKEFAGGEDEGLLQYVGMGDGLRPHIQEIRDDFDLIFLTSDGVHSLEKNVFDKIVQHSDSTPDLCERLVSTSVWTGGQDNASVIGISGFLRDRVGRSQKGPEIVVWNNKSEMQIIWADSKQGRSPPDMAPRPEQQQAVLVDVAADDIQLIEDDELKLEGGRDNSKPASKNQKKKARTQPKDTFGDFG